MEGPAEAVKKLHLILLKRTLAFALQSLEYDRTFLCRQAFLPLRQYS